MEFRSSEMKEVSGEVAREKQFENKLCSDHARHSVDRNGQNLREFTRSEERRVGKECW